MFLVGRLGLFRLLPVSGGGVGVAAVGADEPVYHQLQHAGRLEPVDRRNDEDAVVDTQALQGRICRPYCAVR